MDSGGKNHDSMLHRCPALIALLIAGTLSSAAAADAPDTRPAIVYAAPTVPDSMDPDKAAGSVSVRLLSNLFDTLVQVNPRCV